MKIKHLPLYLILGFGVVSATHSHPSPVHRETNVDRIPAVMTEELGEIKVQAGYLFELDRNSCNGGEPYFTKFQEENSGRFCVQFHIPVKGEFGKYYKEPKFCSNSFNSEITQEGDEFTVGVENPGNTFEVRLKYDTTLNGAFYTSRKSGDLKENYGFAKYRGIMARDLRRIVSRMNDAERRLISSECE